MKVDLNADLGESFGNYKCGMDDEVVRYISSANIACGFHASDPSVMKKTVCMAKKNGVALFRYLTEAIPLHKLPQFPVIPYQHDLFEFTGAEILKTRHLLAGADAAAKDGTMGLGVVGGGLVSFFTVFLAK